MSTGTAPETPLGPPAASPATAGDLLGPAPVPAGLDVAVLHRLDGIFFALRRIVAKPEAAALPVPSLGRQVELSKVVACELLAMHEAAPALTVKDLAAGLLLDHSTTSRLVGEAETEGLVVRGTDPDDRRRTTVELTDLGRAVAADSTYIRTWFMARLVADWDPADVEMLTDLLGRAIRDMARVGPEARAEAEARLGEHLDIPLDC